MGRLRFCSSKMLPGDAIFSSFFDPSRCVDRTNHLAEFEGLDSQTDWIKVTGTEARQVFSFRHWEATEVL